jgi:hypothetical protein
MGDDKTLRAYTGGIELKKGKCFDTLPKPWEEYPEIWKTKAAFYSFIRGGLRRGIWEKHPVKLQFIREKRERVPLGVKKESNPSGEVWGGQCGLCLELFKQSHLQVDHLKQVGSLNSLEDVLAFVANLSFISGEGLMLVCKPCHKIKSYAERMGISFEEARIEKIVIEFKKLNSKEQMKVLNNVNSYFDGVSESDVKNASDRVKLYRAIVRKEYE